MMDTSLTEEDSAFVKNEVQEINIDSNMIPEGYKIALDPDYTAPVTADAANATGVVQQVLIESLGFDAPFVLSLFDTQTVFINMGASAEDVAIALNDMPFLAEYQVLVEEGLAEGNNNFKKQKRLCLKNYNIYF